MELGAASFVILVNIGFLSVGPVEKPLLSMPSTCVAVARLLPPSAFLLIVRGLVMREVKTPPIIARDANAVCGTIMPKITVASINGAPNSQKRAQHIAENAVILRLSSLTSSTVQVVSMDSVVEMATFEIMAESMSSATRASNGTKRLRKKRGNMKFKQFYLYNETNLQFVGTSQPR